MRIIIFIVVIIFTASFGLAQKKSDAHILGHVIANGEHIAYANVYIKNTTIGTSTDETGHYKLFNVPEGEYIVVARVLGYKIQEIPVKIKQGNTYEINFELEPDVLGLNEITVTGSRNEISRKESSVIVSMLSSKDLQVTTTNTINEGLNFLSGLRVENNCQNCGFNQLRMNGLEGPYSQILINSKAIFSGLAGVYGLELIPANMIERIEVVRGGGSSLYGSNAIGGTVNIILKDPINNTFNFGGNTSLIGIDKNYSNPAIENNVSMNATVVTGDSRTGLSIYGYRRNRKHFDANGDDFSELSQAKNYTIGARTFHRFNSKTKISLDYFSINEDRRGGNGFDNLPHMSDITEGAEHNINTVSLNLDVFLNSESMFSVYSSGQHILRDSYYGANHSLSDYGKTFGLTTLSGIQYKCNVEKTSLLLGIERTDDFLKDKKLGYPDIYNISFDSNGNPEIEFVPDIIVANQILVLNSAFMQLDRKIGLFKLSGGARFDNYSVKNNIENSNISGNVVSPRINVLFTPTTNLQLRGSYSRGFRAPQVFDEDLHIETSGARQVINRNDPDLKQETSNSFTFSADYTKNFKNIFTNLLIEGFYTRLNNPFVNHIGEPDDNGVVIYTRTNADAGATVYGINMELKIIPSSKFNFRGGYTYQRSLYDEEQEFDERRFFRTPNSYGFAVLNYNVTNQIALNSSATYTGKMLVPYFGNTIEIPEGGELRTTSRFFDMGAKISYSFKLNGASMTLNAGIKNIFNSYQKDFDIGIDRDPSYIYGPLYPRTVYFGVSLGNF